MNIENENNFATALTKLCEAYGAKHFILIAAIRKDEHERVVVYKNENASPGMDRLARVIENILFDEAERVERAKFPIE